LSRPAIMDLPDLGAAVGPPKRDKIPPRNKTPSAQLLAGAWHAQLQSAIASSLWRCGSRGLPRVLGAWVPASALVAATRFKPLGLPCHQRLPACSPPSSLSQHACLLAPYTSCCSCLCTVFVRLPVTRCHQPAPRPPRPHLDLIKSHGIYSLLLRHL
jgi:hypothetical protein